jgi:hypothetical protein
MARSGTTTAWTFMALALGAGCGGSDPAAETPDNGSGGTGTSTAASSGSSSSGGSSFTCDPPADPGSIYALAAVSYDINQIDPVSMCKYRGDVMLIVNTAAL